MKTNAQTAATAPEPTYDVRPLFGDRYQVTNTANQHRHYVTVKFDRASGDFKASGHACPGTAYVGFCAHQRAALRHARRELNQQMAAYFNG